MDSEVHPEQLRPVVLEDAEERQDSVLLEQRPVAPVLESVPSTAE